MTDFTWNISFQLTGSYAPAGGTTITNQTAMVTGTIVTDSDSGILQQSDFVSWSFIFSDPAVGFSGAVGGDQGTMSLNGNIFSASGGILSYVFDPGGGSVAGFFTNPAPAQVAFGIDLFFANFVQGDIRLQDPSFDQFDGIVAQPFQIGTEAVATPADISIVNTGLIDIDLSSIIGVGGNVTITGNTSLTTLAMDSLTTVGGDVTITGNTSVTTIEAASLTTVSGSVTITGNVDATTIDFASLTTTNGDVTITSGADATLDASALGPGGGTADLIGDNLTTTINLGDLAHMDGTLTISSADGVTLTAHAGLADLAINGTDADNVLIGSATANNTIDGKLGDDLMTGGHGDDNFVFDFSVSQQTQSHHDFFSLADVTSVTLGDITYDRPALTASITAWNNWNAELTSWANSQPNNTGGDEFTSFTNSNPKHVGTIQLIDGYFHDYKTTTTTVAGDGFDTITNFGSGNDTLLFKGLSNDPSAASYWANVLSSTTADSNTIIHVHDVANNGADTSDITLLGVTTNIDTLAHSGVVHFDTGLLI